MTKQLIKIWMPPVISVSLLIAWIGTTFLLMAKFLDPSITGVHIETLMAIYAAVSMRFSTVVDYYLGSSELKDADGN